MDKHEQIPIWFFIGVLLLVYGVIITAAGVYYIYFPCENKELALQYLHADLWWGILLAVLGGFYTLHFAPWRGRK